MFLVGWHRFGESLYDNYFKKGLRPLKKNDIENSVPKVVQPSPHSGKT